MSKTAANHELFRHGRTSTNPGRVYDHIEGRIDLAFNHQAQPTSRWARFSTGTSSSGDNEETGELYATNGSLFFTSDKSIKVLDVSNPLHPRLTAAYPTVDQATAVSVSQGYAYVTVGDSGLQVIRLNEQVTDITLIDSQSIKATFPSRLLPGIYDIAVVNSDGTGGRIEKGYIVRSANKEVSE